MLSFPWYCRICHTSDPAADFLAVGPSGQWVLGLHYPPFPRFYDCSSTRKCMTQPVQDADVSQTKRNVLIRDIEVEYWREAWMHSSLMCQHLLAETLVLAWKLALGLYLDQESHPFPARIRYLDSSFLHAVPFVSPVGNWVFICTPVPLSGVWRGAGQMANGCIRVPLREQVLSHRSNRCPSCCQDSSINICSKFIYVLHKHFYHLYSIHPILKWVLHCTEEIGNKK